MDPSVDLLQVLNVACGVWHTAAVVVENEGPLGQALMGASPQAPSRPTEQQQQQRLLRDGAPPRLESSALSMSHHRRNSSASSAFSEVWNMGMWELLRHFCIGMPGYGFVLPKPISQTRLLLSRMPAMLIYVNPR